MGWKKYKRNIMAGLRTMATIKEEPEECRTPTPVEGSGDQDVKQEDKASKSGDVTPTDGSRPNSSNDGLLGAPIETSFSDHLQSLVEDYTREIITKDRQLRDLRKEKKELYIEFWNYKLSWTMDRAEMDELRAELAEERKEKERMKEEYSKLAEEHNEVQNKLDAILKEKNQTQSRSVRSSVEEEDKQDRIPTAPKSPAKMDSVPKSPEVKVQRRPYTGKSREALLPPITENNKVVKSSVAPSRPESRESLVHLPPIVRSSVYLPSIVSPPSKLTPSPPSKLTPSPPSKLTPSPPRLPRTSKSSRSRIPWDFPPLRRGS